MAAMIQIHQLRKRLGRRDVLQGLDLAIERNQRVALIGSNGAGKTTLIRCLLGEYACDGQVSLVGHDPRRYRTEVLRHVGFVPQLPPPLKMPVGQLIRYVASLCGTDRQRIEAVSQRLGFDAARFHHQPFVRLSGGQKQKLLIATALGRDADVLVLDEPAANLDPEVEGLVQEAMARLLEGRTALLIAHRLSTVWRADRILVMAEGRIVEEGTHSSLMAGGGLYSSLVGAYGPGAMP